MMPTYDRAGVFILHGSGLNTPKVDQIHSASCFAALQHNVFRLHIPVQGIEHQHMTAMYPNSFSQLDNLVLLATHSCTLV